MIKADVRGQALHLTSGTTVADSVKYLRIQFEFSEDWDGTDKTALFRHDDETIGVVLNKNSLLYCGDGEYYVPHEVIKPPLFSLSVFGVKGDTVITTPAVGVRVTASGYGEGTYPADPTPTEYQQILETAARAEQIAESVRKDADDGKFNGGGGGSSGGKGEKGDPGKSAYELACGNGFDGSETEWLASLKGEKGDTGADGHTPVKGTDYWTETDREEIQDYIKSQGYLTLDTLPKYNGGVE